MSRHDVSSDSIIISVLLFVLFEGKKRQKVCDIRRRSEEHDSTKCPVEKF